MEGPTPRLPLKIPEMKNSTPNSFEKDLHSRLKKIEDDVIPTIAKWVADLRKTTIEMIQELGEIKKGMAILREKIGNKIESSPPYRENLN